MRIMGDVRFKSDQDKCKHKHEDYLKQGTTVQGPGMVSRPRKPCYTRPLEAWRCFEL